MFPRRKIIQQLLAAVLLNVLIVACSGRRSDIRPNMDTHSLIVSIAQQAGEDFVIYDCLGVPDFYRVFGRPHCHFQNVVQMIRDSAPSDRVKRVAVFSMYGLEHASYIEFVNAVCSEFHQMDPLTASALVRPPYWLNSAMVAALRDDRLGTVLEALPGKGVLTSATLVRDLSDDLKALHSGQGSGFARAIRATKERIGQLVTPGDPLLSNSFLEVYSNPKMHLHEAMEFVRGGDRSPDEKRIAILAMAGLPFEDSIAFVSHLFRLAESGTLPCEFVEQALEEDLRYRSRLVNLRETDQLRALLANIAGLNCLSDLGRLHIVRLQCRQCQ